MNLPAPTGQAADSASQSEGWHDEFFSHMPEYGAEFAGTWFLLFFVVATVAFMFSPHSSPSTAIPSVGARLFLTGLVLGGVGSLVAISPLGRLSGAHLNPAVSLSFFAEGKMKAHDLIAFVVAQSLGGIGGAWTGAEVFGRTAAAVHDSLTQPGTNVTGGLAVAAEFGCVFVLTGVVLLMLSHNPIMRWTPVGAMFVVAVEVWLDGHFSGASLNPARSLGPALIVGNWNLFWVYVVGPIAGGLAAGLLRRVSARSRAKSGKLFHDFNYRSIFNGERDHQANLHVRRQSGVARDQRPPLSCHGPHTQKRDAA